MDTLRAVAFPLLLSMSADALKGVTKEDLYGLTTSIEDLMIRFPPLEVHGLSLPSLNPEERGEPTVSGRRWDPHAFSHSFN